MKKSKVYRRLLKYYRKSLPLLILVIILVIYSAFANIYGTFMLKDVINAITNSQNDPTNLIYNEEFINLILKMIYLYGAAVIAIVLYTQIVIRISQQVIYQIRSELIEHGIKSTGSSSFPVMK